MKNRLKLITPISVILLVLTSSPALATTIEDLGHSWNDNYFAMVVDVNRPGENLIHLVEDLTPDVEEPATTTDAESPVNNNFFFSYINESGMEVGYLALERLEKTSAGPYNRTAPFQALFTHFKNPVGADVFVVVNFDGLIAYSGGGAAARRLDPTDEVYLGITAAGQGLHLLLTGILKLAALNPVNKLSPDDFNVPFWNVEPFFEVTEDGYSFGMTYYNLLVAWLDLRGKNIETAEDAAQLVDMAKPTVRAVSLFDNVTYRYNVAFETNEETGLTVTSISANYDFGRTKIIGMGYDNDPDADDDDEERVAEFLKNVRDEKGLSGQTLNVFPNQPRNTMVYTDDLAQLRIRGPKDDTPGFGLAVINSANIITIGDATIEKDGKALDPDAAGDVGSVAMIVDGEKTFESDYATKATYDLVWANGTRRDDLPVFNTIIPSGRAGFVTPYFVLQRLILVPWLLVIANEISPQQFGQKEISAEHYFIATQFPAWSGGRIIHDPSFTAYSNPEVTPKTTTSEVPMTTTSEAPMTTTSEAPMTTVQEFTLTELLLATTFLLPIVLQGVKRRKK